ncbi:MAG: PhoH family protein [Chitinophagales bacterium]
MSELIISIGDTEPVELFGVNNSRLNLIKKSFPLLKIVARGNKIKLSGSAENIAQCKNKIEQMVKMTEKYGQLSHKNVEAIMEQEGTVSDLVDDSSQVIVHGSNGLVVKARTPNQRKMVTLSDENDVLFALGPAGTGKTYTAVALAVRALKNKSVRRIILTRPAVEAGENLGFLPGDLKEKIDPYLRPLYDALHDMIPLEKLNYYMQNNVIEVAPLAFMRGRTLDNAFIILDESQNTTTAQLKMFLTRIGPSAKCIITGDMSQVDLPKNQKSGLRQAAEILGQIEGIGTIHLKQSDVIRHKLVKEIIKAYEILEEQEKNPKDK